MSEPLEEHVQPERARWRNPSKGLYLAVLPWLLGAALLLNAWRVDREVATRQRVTMGTITGHEPANHDRYSYEFHVAGRLYRGWEIPQDDEWTVGQVVVVYYDPTDPATNALTDFAERGLHRLGPVPCLLGGVATWGLVIFLLRRSARSRLPVE